MSRLRGLSEVLSEIDELPWNHAVYMAFDKKWNLNTQCAVLDPEDCECGAEVPEFAAENGLNHVLSVQQIQDIRVNATAQKRGLTDQEMFEAFVYYHDNDAFIKL